jgi:predicted phosphodiesterase
MKSLFFLILSFIIFNGCRQDQAIEPVNINKAWRFIVVGDTHVTTNSDTIQEMIPYFLKDSVDLVVVCGDIVEGGLKCTAVNLKSELLMWETIFRPLYENGINVFPVRGNHENDASDNIAVWNSFFSAEKALPQNGPAGETNLTCSFIHKNAKFILLDNYVSIHRINQAWLNEQMLNNKQSHIFVFAHEAAFKVFHSDCLDDYLSERNAFWKSMIDFGVRTYFCGHDHFFDVTQIDNGDNDVNNDIYQCVIGGGGGWIMSKYMYNGNNEPYVQNAKFHRNEHGYALVEINGDSADDLDVKIIWKERKVNVADSSVEYLSTPDVISYTVKQKN